MRCKFSYSLEVEEPVLGDVPGVLGQLTSFLRVHGVTDELFIGQFELAAAEAINNATTHGCADALEKFLRLRLLINKDHVELRVTDPSDFRGWDNDPCLPGNPIENGGRGHYIMFKMTDTLLHEEEEGCHVLVLRKRFFNASWQYVPGEVEDIVTQMTEELVSSYELIDTVVNLGKALAMAPDINDFMGSTLEKLCRVTGADAAYVRFDNEGSLRLLCQWGTPLNQPLANIETTDSGVEADVYRTGREVTLTLDTRLPDSDPLSTTMLAGFVTPIIYRDKSHGVLVLIATNPSPYFDSGKLKVARIVSEYFGIIMALSQAQKHKEAEQAALHDLKTAAKIQLSLMPQDFPPILGLDVYGTSLPCLQSGGDYFDILTLPDGSILCMIADVMGKGLPAALLAIMLRTNVHALIASGESDSGIIITNLNKLMWKDLYRLEVFITMVCAVISPERKKISSASAGHLSPILQKDGGPILQIEGTGVPIGIFLESTYSSQSTIFEIGDRLFLCTDGITESSDKEGTRFEMRGVEDCLLRSRRLSSQATAKKLLNEVEIFTEGSSPSDDRTVIIVSRTK